MEPLSLYSSMPFLTSRGIGILEGATDTLVMPKYFIIAATINASVSMVKNFLTSLKLSWASFKALLLPEAIALDEYVPQALTELDLFRISRAT